MKAPDSRSCQRRLTDNIRYHSGPASHTTNIQSPGRRVREHWKLQSEGIPRWLLGVEDIFPDSPDFDICSLQSRKMPRTEFHEPLMCGRKVRDRKKIIDFVLRSDSAALSEIGYNGCGYDQQKQVRKFSHKFIRFTLIWCVTIINWEECLMVSVKFYWIFSKLHKYMR